MSTTIEMLNKIKTLLNVEVKMEKLKLENGTQLEADKFSKGESVFILTEDEKVPLPVGEYEMQDGRLLSVEQEGVILSLDEVSKETEEEIKEQEEEEEMAEDDEADVEDWAGMEKRIKNLEDAVADLKKRVGKDEAEIGDKEEKEETEDLNTELSKPATAAIKHVPVESKNVSFSSQDNNFTYATTTIDRVMERINNIRQK